ncbi:Dienelactone hydrolase [Solimonas aquatica]|uniref:Dienelactone hydrolase n=1 Tax=Solimonas aquatica TaxID=489703 RepID=A0A1H9CQ05_9GAMM|nr:alpha/beta fold hydrolase [Solimonas aquatica]SEQ03244.1 Dienelactone hydrolase [Solimonas aquatica]
MRLKPLMPAALLLLAACGGTGDKGSGLEGTAANAYSLFDPVASSAVIPFPFDGLFQGSTDGTLNIPNSSSAPFVTAANALDGFSTTASLFTDFIGYVDVAHALDINATTHLPGVIVIDSSTLTPLTPGVDYRLASSKALDTATGLPLNQLRTRLLIEPLKPLKPQTTYLVVVTTQVKSTDGVAAQPADLFRVVRSTTAVAQQSEPVLTTISAANQAKLEAIRQQFAPMFAALGAAGIARENIVIAWPFTTQSATKTLTRMAQNISARAITVVATGLTTHDLSAALPAIADVYAGTTTLPYYLGSPSEANPAAPLSAYWQADTSQRDSAASIQNVSCTQWAASVSTTACYPLPLQQSVQTVPVLVTVPNAGSGRTMPVGGWPVVIFQHGITGNRSQMLAIAPALALAGFATIAIDLPLHGLPPTSPLRISGVPERTFDLDVLNNTTGAAGADGTADSSGASFINLSSLLTSRDNLRQAAVDLLQLKASVGGTLLLTSGHTPSGITFSGSGVHVIGHSLGGIVAGTMLGVDGGSEAAVLAMPGGGIAKLLDGSASFGPRIAAGLAAASNNAIAEGNDNFETFLRFAQTAVDSGDPINFAASAATTHPLLMLEVQGDTVVPNCTIDAASCAALDTVTDPGYLSGSDPLARILGLGYLPGPAASDTLSVPASAQTLTGSAARNQVVRFAQGTHGSILDPGSTATTLAVTCEMQGEVASFLASNGLLLQIGNACPSSAQ